MPADLPVPTVRPPWMIGIVVAVGYAVLLLSADLDMPFAIVDPRAAPAATLGGVLLYAIVVWVIFRQDPRVWRNPVSFAEGVRRWSAATGRPMPDADGVQRLRAMAWRDTSVALAQQAGLCGGAGAGVTFTDHGGPIALIVFTVTMFVVGLAVKTALMAPDRAALGPLLPADG